jgi:uncharacterized membrane protein YfcA
VSIAASPVEIALLVAALLAGGLVSGFFAGLLGIGGGGVLVPVLYEVLGAAGISDSVRMHVALGTSLAVIIPTSLRSFAAHRASGAVDMDLWRSMAPFVVAGVLCGAVVARYASTRELQWLWVFTCSAMAAKLAFGKDHWRLGSAVPGQPVRGLYAFAVGLICVLMSIGGAAYIVMFMTLFGRSLHQAVATSSGFGPLIAVPGMLGFIWAGLGAPDLPMGSLGYVSLLGAALVIPASVYAAPIGARLTHGMPRRRLELIFALFLASVCLKFVIGLVW